MSRFTARPNTDTLNAAIARLWNEGVSGNQIAARLGLTKNTVIGRVHRMGLPGRASPIIRNGAPKPKRLSGSGALVGPTLPPVSAPQAVRAALQIAEVATSLPNPPQTVFRARPSRACCWPMWDNRERPTQRFCDAPAPAGEPYCPEHRAVAWVSVGRKVVA